MMTSPRHPDPIHKQCWRRRQRCRGSPTLLASEPGLHKREPKFSCLRTFTNVNQTNSKQIIFLFDTACLRTWIAQTWTRIQETGGAHCSNFCFKSGDSMNANTRGSPRQPGCRWCPRTSPISLPAQPGLYHGQAHWMYWTDHNLNNYTLIFK